MRSTLWTTLTSLALILGASSGARAATILDETWSTPATQGQLASLYPQWTLSGNVVDASVTGGAFRLDGDGAAALYTYAPPLPGAFTLVASMAADPGHQNVNIGLRIGNNDIVFHPGYPGTGLRVEGPGGSGGNLDTGFTLTPYPVFNRLQIVANGLGGFTVTLTDLQAPGQPAFQYSYSNPSAVGGQVSIRREGTGGYPGAVLIDRITVTTPGPAVPEPTSAAFAAIGLAAVAASRRRHRAA